VGGGGAAPCVSSASCLAFGPPQDALALLSTLSLRLLGADEEEEEEASGSGQRRKADHAPPSSSFLSRRVFLSTPGLDSHLSELPTCLDCLDRIDPLVLGVSLGKADKDALPPPPHPPRPPTRTCMLA
jgi:hypothetical protein